MASTVLVSDTMKIGVSTLATDSKSDIDDENFFNDNGSNNPAPVWESAKASLAERKKRKRPTASLLKNAMEDLDRIWMNANAEEEEEHREAPCEAKHQNAIPASDMCRIRQTTELLVKVFTEDIHEPAIRALVTNEELQANQMKLKSELETAQKEVERLRRSEQRSKEVITNLLKAVTDSAERTKDESQSKLVEAKMRSDVLNAITERDAAKKELVSSNRSFDLLSQDMENLKKDRTKLQHDKIGLEREVRMARALADQLSSSLLSNGKHMGDLDHYKGKSKGLEIQLQGMTARLAEKNQEILELRRCNNRNLSQHRLDALKATWESTTENSAKRSRNDF